MSLKNVSFSNSVSISASIASLEIGSCLLRDDVEELCSTSFRDCIIATAEFIYINSFLISLISKWMPAMFLAIVCKVEVVKESIRSLKIANQYCLT